jgi:hypothetical protein
MYSREEIMEEIERFNRDNSTEETFFSTIVDFIEQMQDEANRQGYADRVSSVLRTESAAREPVPEAELFIKVHGAMACAHNDVLAKYIPEGDVDKLILKMTPFVVKYLQEDFNITDKDTK